MEIDSDHKLFTHPWNAPNQLPERASPEQAFLEVPKPSKHLNSNILRENYMPAEKVCKTLQNNSIF